MSLAAIRFATVTEPLQTNHSFIPSFTHSLKPVCMDQQSAPNFSPEFLEQNPLVMVALLGVTLLLFAFLVGALTSWGYLIFCAVNGKPLLRPEQPWKPRVWGFVDILVAAVFVVFWQRQSAILGCSLLGLNRQEIVASQSIPLPLATILGLGNVAAMLTICLWLALRHRASFAQLGFTLSRSWKHIGIGVVAAFASIPLVYALMTAVSYGFDNKYSHPLLEEMKREGSLTAYLLALTSAVLIAPLVEEFLFRVLIQGWLQSVPFGSLKSIFLGQREDSQYPFVATGSGPAAVAPAANNAATQPQQFNAYAAENVPADGAESVASLDANFGPAAQPQQAGDRTSTIPPIWPSFVTGTLFGLAHFGYGLSFIPLIILGIILGLLYRATHSIWPSLVVHFILNGNSMLMLGVSILMEQAKL